MSKKSAKRGCPVLIALLVMTFAVIAACVVVSALFPESPEPGATPQAGPLPAGVLRVAYSPEKGPLFQELVAEFNAQGQTTADGQPIRVEAVEMDPERMIQAGVAEELQAISPDSSIWLDQLDRAWMNEKQTDRALVGETVRYAISPVVIAMWDDVARSMGYPDKRIGWEDIIAKAQADPNFRWSHPSTSTASGLLAALAMFYAGAGKTRGLTIEDAKAEPTLNYVSAVEKTVRQYGEGEWAVIQRVIQEGRRTLDAFVVQEQLVIYHNRDASRPRLTAVYPQEGTLWEDHPLALLETPDLTPDRRLAFQNFRNHILSKASQERVLSHGFRPTDLTIPLSGSASPVSTANGVNPTEPQTALQVPGPAVVEVVRDVWWYTKRHTNVYLVVDTSGSMRGDKLEAAREALQVFLGQIRGDSERVGIVEFSSSVYNVMPLSALGDGRAALNSEIEGLAAGGDTALLDAVRTAYLRLQDLNDRERINAVVAMTDGQENNSNISLRALVDTIRRGNSRGVPVVVFCIAFGEDADYEVLQAIADASGGQVRQGDLNTIRDLYKILSTYF